MAPPLAMVGLDGRGLTGPVRDALAEGRLAGLIVFREDAPDLGSMTALITEARALSPTPLLVGIDEEGGLVTQLDGLRVQDTVVRAGPSASALAILDDATTTRRVHTAVGEILSATGIDLAFAPVADVNDRPRNPVIGSRAFGVEPDRVTRHARAAASGLAAGGVHPTAKHFPGHGAAVVDSHVDLPTIDDPRDRIVVRDLAPFRALIGDGVPAIMVGHLVVPALDPGRRPASRSRAILTDLLRGAMGFGGLVVSDAMEMAGFGAELALDAPVAEALRAGVDLFVLARGVDRLPELLRALDGVAATDPDRVRDAAERVSRLHRPSRPGTEPDRLRRVVDRHAPFLLEVHRRAVRVLGTDALSFADEPVRVVMDPSIPRPRLDPDLVAAGLAAGGLGAVEVVSPDRAVADLPRGTPLFVVLYGRGELSRPGFDLLGAIEGWRVGEPGRRVVALAPADAHVLAHVPAGWGRVAVPGTGRTAFEATAEALIRRSGGR
jgi:beta-N-acetylhexosaminidase